MARWLRFAVGFWLAAAVVVWNGFFDVLVGCGQRDYLLAQARHDMGLGPAVSMDAIMSASIRAAAWQASLWGVGVFLAGLAASARIRRLSRGE